MLTGVFVYTRFDIEDDSNSYLIRFTLENDEDRGSAFSVVL